MDLMVMLTALLQSRTGVLCQGYVLLISTSSVSGLCQARTLSCTF